MPITLGDIIYARASGKSIKMIEEVRCGQSEFDYCYYEIILKIRDGYLKLIRRKEHKFKNPLPLEKKTTYQFFSVKCDRIKYESGRCPSKFSDGLFKGEYKYHLWLYITINDGRVQGECNCNMAKLLVVGERKSLSKLLKYIKDNCENVQLIKK